MNSNPTKRSFLSALLDHLPVQRFKLDQRIFSGGIWAVLGKIAGIITALLVNVLLTRLLIPRDLGIYFIVFSVATIGATVAQLGLGQAVVRLVAESMGTGRHGRAKAAIQMVLRYGVLGTIGVVGVLVLGGGQWLSRRLFFSPIPPGIVVYSVPLVIGFTFQNLLAESFRGFHNIRLAALFGGLVSSILSTTFLGLLWIFQTQITLSKILVLSGVAHAINIGWAWFRLRRTMKNLDGVETLNGYEVMSLTWPLWVVSLAYLVFTQADIWILGAFRPQEDVAIYGVAMRLVVLVTAPLLIVNSVIPPIIAEMYSNGKRKELERILRSTATMAGIPALIILLVFASMGGQIMSTVYGSFYRSGASILFLLSLGQLVNVWAGSCGMTLMMTGHQTIMMYITILCGIITVGAALVIAERYGTVGVAAISASGLALQNILMWLAVKRKVDIRTHVTFDWIYKLIWRES